MNDQERLAIPADIPLGRVVASRSGPVVMVAEAACEHQGSLDEARRMVDLARESGADVIKFQLHLPEREMLPGRIRFWAGGMDEILARVNLPPRAQEELMAHCERVGIQYLCTPFCAEAADILHAMGVPAFKIGSGELTNLPMLRHVARLGRPMIVSTGMAEWSEVARAVAALKEEGAAFMLTHCVSAYPPRDDQANLRLIPRLEREFGVLAGFSDHSTEDIFALAAVALGARLIEKHFTPDRARLGPDHHVSLEPAEFLALTRSVRRLEAALGEEKKIHPQEAEVRAWAHHSVVTVAPLEAGDILTREKLAVKRPGGGIPAWRLDEVIGRRAARRVPADQTLRWEDLEEPAG